ncbi:aromatic ring-hydroxylating dioxygenase subunit alpha [Mycobacterium sp. E2479]|uniref:aromatic ring-hydroxylating oxygenase subunit alpha n=1 Tax=Mycobacterium sp. E2479 TaxID=1834134 RepID=UPI0007FE2A42|nr:aromatic ring-hydroxylating dioxygenase subunit alpha [Mycobacterium sp. E2479]OBH49275.1 hypothetical protein A5686_15455 [Mycobacterium sp. E2479]
MDQHSAAVQESHDLTRRALAHIEANTLDIAADIWTESRGAFVSQERFEADRAMLLGVPHVIAWAGEIAEPGQYITKDVMGIPVLVARSRTGELRAFVNGCAHRGAQVADGRGTTRIFTCPYHGWTYGLDGRLTGAPAKAMFAGAELDKRRLVELPVSDRHGLVTVGLSADVGVDAHLDSAALPLAGYGFSHTHHFETRRFELATNWKLCVNVNFEGYHFPYVHADSLAPMVTNNSPCDTFGQHARWAFPFRDIVQFADRPSKEWPDQFFGTSVFGLFPSCVLVEAPGTSQMLRIYPGARPGECVAYLSYGTPSAVETEAEREWHSNGMEATCLVLRDEDFPMAESCQRGLDGGVGQVVFGRNEPLLHHFASAWQQALLTTNLAAAH